MTTDNDNEKLNKFLSDFDEKIIPAKGLAHAFYGVANGPDGYRAVYSTEKIISQLMEQDLMDFDSAEEYMNVNLISTYQGENAPLFIDIIPDEFWK